MNNHLSLIFRFAKKLQVRVVIQRIVAFCLLSVSIFFVISGILNITFFFFPLLILPFLWDCSCLVLCANFLTGIVYHSFFRCPGQNELLSELESKSKLPHPVAAISLDLAQQPQSFFTDHTFSTGAEQIIILERYFPPVISNRNLFFFFLITFSLVTATMFLPSTAVRYWKLPFVTMNNLPDAKINPGTLTVPRNKHLTLEFTPSDYSIPSSGLTIRSLDNKSEHKYLLHPDNSNRFSFNIDSIDNTVIYQFNLGSKRFKPDTITVMQPPSLLGLNISIKSPSYIGGGAKKLNDGQGDFNTYAGSEITVKVQSNPLRKAFIVFENDSLQMSTAGNSAFSTFPINKQNSYTFSFSDTFNQTNNSLPRYHISIIPDELPVVQIVKPGYNKDLTPELLEHLKIEAIDDFGVSSVILNWYKSSEKDSTCSMDLATAKPTTSFTKEFNWSLNNFHLYPGDSAYYWVSVTDNWPFTPRHICNSDTFWLRIPGFDEIIKSITDKENRAESTIKNVRENQDELEKAADELTESQSSEKEMSWESKQKFEHLKEGLKSQTDSLKNALESLDKSAEQLNEQGSIGNELAQKMNKVQKMVEDLIKQYGDSLFSNLNKPENISMEEMKKAIANVKELLPELSDRLDNTLQFLEALKLDRQIALLAMKAEKLTSEQMKLAKESDSKNSRKAQGNLLDRLDDLQKSIKTELNDSQTRALKNRDNALDSLKKSMQSSLQNSQLPGNEAMNSMGESLFSLSEELKQMISSSQMAKVEKERNTILEMANDIITLSDWQKQIISTPDEDVSSKENAILQQTINDALKKVMNRTDSLTVIPPQIMQQLRENFKTSESALLQTLQSFNQYNNKSNMKESSNSLQSLANTLLKTASTQGQQQSGSNNGEGNMMSGLRKLSQQQGGVNAATSALLQALMNSLKGNQPGQQGLSPMSQGATEKARQAAQEAQRKIGDELNRLMKQYAKSGGDESKTKRLEELRQEAHRLAEMLSTPRSDVTDKQNKFLTRMLQSALSMNKKDEIKEDRKSEISKTTFSGNTVKHSSNELLGPDAFFMLKRKALQGIFPESYRSSINAYFDSLGVIYLKDKD